SDLTASPGCSCPPTAARRGAALSLARTWVATRSASGRPPGHHPVPAATASWCGPSTRSVSHRARSLCGTLPGTSAMSSSTSTCRQREEGAMRAVRVSLLVSMVVVSAVAAQEKTITLPADHDYGRLKTATHSDLAQTPWRFGHAAE